MTRTLTRPPVRQPFAADPAYVRGVLDLYDRFTILLLRRRLPIELTRREYRAGFRITGFLAVLQSESGGFSCPMGEPTGIFGINVAFFAAASSLGLLWVDGVQLLPPGTRGVCRGR
jgi:hypothetical protein